MGMEEEEPPSRSITYVQDGAFWVEASKQKPVRLPAGISSVPLSLTCLSPVRRSIVLLTIPRCISALRSPPHLLR